MRHTLASQLLRNGISLPVISETLSHKDTKKSNGLQNRTVQDSVKPPTDIKGALRLQR